MSQTTNEGILGTVYLNSTLKGGPLDEQEVYTRDAWKRSPNFELLLAMDMPQVVETPCCASFIVTRRRIIKRPKQVYENLRQWLIDTDMDNYYSSRVMEYTWHILFGDLPVTRALKLNGDICESLP
jgi:hypothetical protein